MRNTTRRPPGLDSRSRHPETRRRLPRLAWLGATLGFALAAGVAGVAGVALRPHQDHALLVTGGPDHAAPRSAAPTLMWGTANLAPPRHRNPRLDPLLAPALPVGFAAIDRYDGLLDPASWSAPAPRPIGHSAPLQASLRPLAPAQTAVAGLPIPVLEPGQVPVVQASLGTQAAEPDSAPTVLAALPTVPEDIDDDQPVPVPQPRNRLVLGAPMPVPRPPELLASTAPERQRVASPPPSRRIRTASLPAAPAAPVDNRSFFERFFGQQQRPAPGPALAYAPSDDAGTAPVRSGGSGRLLGGFMPGPGPVVAPGTAVYDISARTVYLPNGERLEAHSGLGDKMDDPRHVHVRMHGATPPHTYDLTERESLFHGVRALRLNPVGGSRAIHGRAGLLAHTYMLGPRGDSNGCISFRDYNRFLQAYLRGEVRRLIVVASAS